MQRPADFEFVYRHAPLGICMLALDGSILSANQAFCDLFGYPEAELLERPITDLTHPDDLPLTLAWLRKTPAEHPGVRSFEKRYLHKSGRVVWGAVNVQLLTDPAAGQPCFVTHVQDITERRRVEDALREKEAIFRIAFENAPVGMSVILPSGRYLSVNPKLCEMFGYSEAELLAGALQDITHPDDVERSNQWIRKVISGDTIEPEIEKRFIHKNGETVWGLVRARWLQNPDGSPRISLAHVLDITRRVLREQELVRKTEEMERFTYMISHDLKSPLVTIRTFLGYLEQDLELGKGDRATQDMGFIRDATAKMGRLLGDLLEVSRVGRVMNPPVELSFAEVVQEGLKAVAGALAQRRVAVQVTGPPVRLRGDRQRLEELWQNLIENAVKYLGDQGAPSLELGVEPVAGELVFSVRDNGMGIDPRHQPRIFGLFEQLDPASEGTGLGLALVKRIVELYGGRIWVESAGAGQGACFRFTLPAALAEPAPAPRPGAAGAPPG